MKVTNPVSLDKDIYLEKTTELFRVLQFKNPQKVPIKGLKPFSLYLKAGNTSLWSPSFLQNHLNPKPLVLWQNQLGFSPLEP
jgi:hypothetical protein